MHTRAIGITGVDAYLMVFVNGKYSQQHSNLEAVEGVEIGRLSDAVENGDTVVQQHLGKYASYQTDGFAAWNTAAWNNGVYIRVRENVILEKPVLIHHWNDASNDEVVTLNRNLFVVCRSSEVTVIEKYDSSGNSNHFSNHVPKRSLTKMQSQSLRNPARSGKRYLYSLTAIIRPVSV